MEEEDEKKYRMNLALDAIKKYGEKAVQEELGVSRSREYIDKDDSRREFLDKSFRVVKGRDERNEITAIYDGLRTVRK